MTDPRGRDARIAQALDQVPVPDHAPDFWDRLDDRLATEGGRSRPADASRGADDGGSPPPA